jgi:hypothetical protein
MTILYITIHIIFKCFTDFIKRATVKYNLI